MIDELFESYDDYPAKTLFKQIHIWYSSSELEVCVDDNWETYKLNLSVGAKIND